MKSGLGSELMHQWWKGMIDLLTFLCSDGQNLMRQGPYELQLRISPPLDLRYNGQASPLVVNSSIDL